MSRYIKKQMTADVPQSEPIPGREAEMVQNDAGGFTFKVTSLAQLERWLILGSEGGTYYASERKLTLENIRCLDECLGKEDLGFKAVDLIVDVSTKGRAPKVQTTIFALARAASCGLPAVRAKALLHLQDVCRTGSHILEFVSYVEGMRGWGRQLRNALISWYVRDSAENDAHPVWLAYQALKYRQRESWSHRDVLRKTHPAASKFSESLNAVVEWIVAGNSPTDEQIPDIPIVEGYHRALLAESSAEVAEIVREYGLTHEMIPSEHKSSPIVQEALLEKMPLTAMIRNLASYTKSGLIAPLSDAAKLVVSKLDDEQHLLRSRVHPVQILMAMRTYQSGRGHLGSGAWKPVQAVADALEAAYYKAFGSIQATEKNFYLGIDVSGSMTSGDVAGVPNFPPRDAAACLAMVTARTEKNYHMAGFQSSMVPIDISAKDSLRSACYKITDLPFGGTDCAMPMLDAMEKKIPVDAFVTYTDIQTWAGKTHASTALERYRQKMGRNATMTVVAMTANRLSIADPKDPRQLDVVGFDTAVPDLIRSMALMR